MKKEKKAIKIPKGFEILARLAKAYVEARKAAAAQVRRIRERRRKASARLLPGLARKAAAIGAARSALEAAIEVAAKAGLFKRPRARILAGVKVGYRKRPKVLVIDDEEATIEAIRATCAPAEIALLLETRTKIVKAALKKLPEERLAALGASLVEQPDAMVVKAAADDLDGLVDAVLELAGEAFRAGDSQSGDSK